MNELIETSEIILRFQYESRGYGKYACRSCGSFKHMDYRDYSYEIQESVIDVEECSRSCPWRKLKEAIENAKKSSNLA